MVDDCAKVARTLAARMLSGDATASLKAVEDLMPLLVCSGSSNGIPVPARQDELGAIPELLEGLSNLLRNGCCDGRYLCCLTLSYLLHCHTPNIRLVGKTPGIFEGISEALCEPRLQGTACGVLSQLAFGDRENGARISETRFILDRLTAVLLAGGKASDMQSATCAISNCAANSPELASRIISVPGLLEAVLELCGEPKAGDPERDSRTRVSAIGCIDNLSYHQEVRSLLRTPEVLRVLAPVLEARWDRSLGDSFRVMSAESAMVISRLALATELPLFRVEGDVLRTIMRCLRCAMDGEQLAAFAWRLGELLEPVCRLTSNIYNCHVLSADGACRDLVRVLQMPECSDDPMTTLSGHAPSAGKAHCVHALANLAAHPACRAALAGVRVPPLGAPPGGRQAWQSAAGVLERFSAEGGVGAGVQLDAGIWVLRERRLAVAMAMHPRLGGGSPLSLLDNFLVGEVADASCSAGACAVELAAYLRKDVLPPQEPLSEPVRHRRLGRKIVPKVCSML